MKFLRLIPLLALLLGAKAAGGNAAPEAAAGKHSFAFHQGGKTVLVWYYLPESANRDAPVVIVMHGVGRNGEEYLTDWTALAQERKFLLVVPEFSKAEFPGDPGYNYGNTVSATGQPLPRDVVWYEVPRSLNRSLGLPPPGYKYVRVAGDILLIAVGTQMVVDAIKDLGGL